jgi:hypothetical protein
MIEDGRSWGPWKLNLKSRCLVYTTGPSHNRYECDLERMNSSAEILDWIIQVSHWATPEDLGSFVEAIRDVLDPQATVCGGGRDRRLGTVN